MAIGVMCGRGGDAAGVDETRVWQSAHAARL